MAKYVFMLPYNAPDGEVEAKSVKDAASMYVGSQNVAVPATASNFDFAVCGFRGSVKYFHRVFRPVWEARNKRRYYR